MMNKSIIESIASRTKARKRKFSPVTQGLSSAQPRGQPWLTYISPKAVPSGMWDTDMRGRLCKSEIC